MGLLKDTNDHIWEWIFAHIFSAMTDNVAIMIILTSVIVALVLSVLRLLIFKKHAQAFSLLDYGFVLSVATMITRLPIIHRRINLALSTTVSVIGKSTGYAENLAEVSGIVNYTPLKFATYLYDLPAKARATFSCEPSALYEHLFRTFDKIRGMWIFGEVHISSFGKPSFFFILVILIALIGFLIAIANMDETGKMGLLLFAIKIAFLIYTTTLSNGTTLCALTLWGTEVMFIEFVRSVKETEI